MKTLHKTIVGGICCIAFGISEIVIAMLDYQHRIYVIRYVDSGCKPGSGCPLPLIVWIAGEYHHLTNTGPTQCFGGTTSPVWSTYIASASLWCITPSSGTWTITSTCTLGSNFNPPGDVFISSNSVLTVPSGLTLGVDFTLHKLYINPGSGVLIKPGGKIS